MYRSRLIKEERREMHAYIDELLSLDWGRAECQPTLKTEASVVYATAGTLV